MNVEQDNNNKKGRSQLIKFVRGSYLDRTSRPIYALAYLLVFLILYEVGSILLSPEALSRSLTEPQIRVVSFVWVQNLLGYIGFSERLRWLATPLVVAIILLALQVTSRTSWWVRLKDFVPMTLECIALAIPLIVLSLLLNRSVNYEAMPQNSVVCSQLMVSTEDAANGRGSVEQGREASDINRQNSLAVDVVTGIGAGIYEELVFRLIMICALMFIFQDFFKLSQGKSIVLSVLVSAAFFSLHHHVVFVNSELRFGEVFSIARFSFRVLAGIYFAVLFAVRGFGIAAGTHVFYDIIAAFLNAFVFAGANQG